MSTLQIKKDDAIKAHENAKKDGKKLLENLFGKSTFLKDIMERVQSFEDICKEMERNPNDFICNSDDIDDIAANALKQALLISRYYNQDKVLDWTNSNQPKYCHYYEKTASGWALVDVGGWYSLTLCGSRLYFADKNHAQDAWNKFPHIYINLIK